MNHQGYVAVFSKPLDAELIGACVASWLQRFEGVEQVAPKAGSGPHFTLSVKKPEEIMFAADALQFRVTEQGQFTWLYLTQNRRAIETTGLPESSLCLDVLLELPYVTEIVSEDDEKRLDELEAQGVL